VTATHRSAASRQAVPLPGALFAYGFRPFFLAAGLAALLLVPWWAASFAFGAPLGSGWPPTLWHSHEMLFGFIGAAIAGFLLTAVPSWTGRRGFAGWPLALLAAVWLLGRVLVSSAAVWPLPLVAGVDLAFLPVLFALVARPLVRARNRNTPVLGVLLLLWLADVAFYRALAGLDATSAARALRVGIDVVLVLATVIGGRIVPAFTSSGLKARGDDTPLRAWRGVTPIVITLMVAIAVVDAVRPDGRVALALALGAALVQAVRMLQWRTLHTLREPLVWVLHLGYAWLPLGLALKALALYDGAAGAAFWLHGLTIGALATLILGVMSRATLGHTGRPLVASATITAAYLLLAAAAVVRVFGLLWWRHAYPGVIVLSGLLWTGAFALFIVVYAPMLWAPRVDGKPG
jgi:uncharacterized protein involved in response to NO